MGLGSCSQNDAGEPAATPMGPPALRSLAACSAGELVSRTWAIVRPPQPAELLTRLSHSQSYLPLHLGKGGGGVCIKSERVLLPHG